jgi:hypothetical protein
LTYLPDTQVRNDFEHIDQRLEKWADESKHHNYFDYNIGLLPNGVSVDGGPPPDKDVFRNYNPENGEMMFWGSRFYVHEVMKEIQTILPEAHRQAQEWPPPPEATPPA